MSDPNVVSLHGGRFLRVLHDGETWHPHPLRGIIIAHPDRPPLWVRIERGLPHETVIEPAP